MPWTACALAGGVVAAAWTGPGQLLPAIIGVLALLLPGVSRTLRVRAALLALLTLLGALRFHGALEHYRATSEALLGSGRLVGVVTGLPERRGPGLSFRLAIREADGRPVHAGAEFFWFRPQFTPRPGDRLAVEARLRRPRGLANPGGFDREAWAFAEGLHVTGSIRAVRWLGRAGGPSASLDRWRLDLAAALRAELDGPASRLLPALAVGDRRWLSEQDREVLVTTGTMHLLAISGLHVGLVAGLGMLAGALAWPLVARRWTRRGLAFLCGLAPALLYAGLAGFSLSTIRALLMFLAAAAGWWTRGRISWLEGLCWSAAGLLLVDPAAVCAAGFWLSYGSVGLLVFAARGWLGAGRLRLLVRAQLALLLGLRPVASAFALPGSWLAPAVNLLAIPWVGWLVVPGLLLGLAGLAAGLMPAIQVLGAAAWALDCFHRCAAWLAGRASAWAPAPIGGPWGFLALACGAVLLLLPGGLRLRLPGLVLFLAGSLAPPSGGDRQPSLDVHVLDVGQGLAVLLESGERWLLYDAGGISATGWSAGRAIVAPFLRRRGVRSLDGAVLSHGDDDHAGGWPGLLEAGIPVRRLWSADVRLGGEPCLAGDAWRWGGARLRFLHPTPGLPYLGNDSSCVLLLEFAGRRVLLPGDASAAVEARIAPGLPRIDLLLAGHHGSASSSSAEFLARIRPRWVVLSHGHGNRFGMPRPEVLDRMGDARVLSTAACGYLRLRMAPSGVWLVHAEREARQRPWHRESRDDGLENQYDCRHPRADGPRRRTGRSRPET